VSGKAFPASRVLVGVTGASAAVVLPSALMWMRSVLRIEALRVVMTAQAEAMVSVASLKMASGAPALVGWEAADREPSLRVPHVDLARWAELILVMPATANVLGKVANGIADDLLTTCVLAAACPVVLVPSMNETMWRNAAVQRNVRQLRADGHHVIEPVAGYELSSNGTGMGSMPNIPEVMEQAARVLVAAAAPSIGTGRGGA
jgi:phosphopantothenoylcysteine decarboxylase/phosphopantothenate--cysteine ligase